MSFSISPGRARLGLLQVSLAGVLWGTGGLVMQLIRDREPMSVLVVSTWRMVLAAVVTWVATLVTGTPPAGLHRFASSYVRYVTHLNAYLWLVANPYPGFVGEEGEYPIDVRLPPPDIPKNFPTLPPIAQCGEDAAHVRMANLDDTTLSRQRLGRNEL